MLDVLKKLERSHCEGWNRKARKMMKESPRVNFDNYMRGGMVKSF
jgi:hypothetical protein